VARRRNTPKDVTAQLRPATHEQLRAMAHPLRIRLLEALARTGPATASQLARELGESSGATSYHLRVLAQAELIHEDANQPSGRERWWRDASALVGVRRGSDDPDERAVEAAIRAVDVERADEALSRLVAEEERLDPAWRKALFIYGWTVKLTPTDAEELVRDVRALIAEYEDRRPPIGAIGTHVTFRVIPWITD
jgi:DNA-binding transcriptional ArsR family regulator